MTDIERAKRLLAQGKYTCVICRDEDIHTSRERGVAPLVKLLDGGAEIEGYCAADRAVGRAAAMLFVLLGVGEIYAAVMSRGAKKVLDAHGIKSSCGEEVEYIINRRGDGMCPMEKAVEGIDDPAEGAAKIKEALARLRTEN